MKAKKLNIMLAITIGLLLAGALIFLASAGKRPVVAQAGGSLILASAASDGTPGNSESSSPALSADGHYVAFSSWATNLVSGDTNDAPDIFVRDLQTGAMARVSIAADGTQANGYSYSPALSSDGRFVAFSSDATNLVANDTNGRMDIFVHDRDTDTNGIFDEPGEVTTTLVSVSSGGSQGIYHSYSPDISGDGRYVAFETSSSMVGDDTNGYSDIFVRDRDADEDGIFDEPGAVSTVRVSIASDGTQGNDHSYLPTLSADGRYVAFYSVASNLVGDDTNGKIDVFVHDRDADENGIFDEPGAVSTVRVSVASDGTQGNDHSYPAAISGDGRYVAFRSAASNLVDDDTNGYDDIFIHDLQTGETWRVSLTNCGDQGDNNSGSSDDPMVALSTDGRYVAFPSSAQNLVSGDTNYKDIFVRDRALGQTALVSAEPDSVTGIGRDSVAVAISGDGRYVAFETYQDQIYVRDRGSLPPPDAPNQLLHVALSGTDVAGCGDIASPCRTVQYAVNQASCGATIKVATGVYTDIHPLFNDTSVYTQVLAIPTSLTIIGGYTTADWNTSDPDANPTTLDAQEQGQVAYIYTDPQQSVVLDGLRLVNGRGGSGAGIYGWRDTALTVRHCEVLSSTATSDGGGLYLYGGHLTLENSRVVSNTAYVGGGIFVRDATLTMTNSLVQDNVAQHYGGGAVVYQCGATVADNTFEGNRSEGWGGGLEATWGDLLLTGNTFRENVASGDGGGFYGGGIHTGHVYTITDNLFQGNIASRDGSSTGGGARILSGATGDRGFIVFSRNRLLDNVASDGPTGANGGRGGGAHITGPALISDNLFQNNWGCTEPTSGGYEYGGYGGALYLMGTGLQVEGNRFLDNRAARDAGIDYTREALGGAVFVAPYGTVVTMTNNIFAGNAHCEDCTAYETTVEWYRGGSAVAVEGSHSSSTPDARAYLYHNTFADNQSSAVRIAYAAAVTMSHNIFSGHDTDVSNVRTYNYTCPASTLDYTLWWPEKNVVLRDIYNQCSPPTTAHDFTGDPAFAGSSDYHITSGSAAIDRGPGVGVAEDIDGNPRPLGAGFDLGADEYTGVDLFTSSRKTASPSDATAGQVVTFTIVLFNGGTTDAPNTTLFDPIPASTTYVPGSAQATSGVLTDTGGIAWTGTVAAQTAVIITFQVTVSQDVLIANTAVVTDTYGTTTSLTAWVNAEYTYLPMVSRAFGP